MSSEPGNEQDAAVGIGNTGLGSINTANCGGPVRALRWDELTDMQRIYVLRNTVRDLRRTVLRQGRQLEILRSISRTHQHGAAGAPLFAPETIEMKHDDNPPDYSYDPLA